MPGPKASNPKMQIEGSEAGTAQQTYQEVQRVLSLLSGRGPHQTREYLAAQVSPQILSHLKRGERIHDPVVESNKYAVSFSSLLKCLLWPPEREAQGLGLQVGKLSQKARRLTHTLQTDTHTGCASSRNSGFSPASCCYSCYCLAHSLGKGSHMGVGRDLMHFHFLSCFPPLGHVLVSQIMFRHRVY